MSSSELYRLNELGWPDWDFEAFIRSRNHLRSDDQQTKARLQEWDYQPVEADTRLHMEVPLEDRASRKRTRPAESPVTMCLRQSWALRTGGEELGPKMRRLRYSESTCDQEGRRFPIDFR